MGCSSGIVSSLTSMTGGWKVWTMDSGRPELLRFRTLVKLMGLSVIGVSIGEPVPQGWLGATEVCKDKGALELRCDGAWKGDSLGGEDPESSLLCPESWDINERTVVVIRKSLASSARASKCAATQDRPSKNRARGGM